MRTSFRAILESRQQAIGDCLAQPERDMFPTAASLPGFDSPMELLLACHDKVRHFAGLCSRLEQHAARRGADEEARAAAASVLRYFQLAAPLHHADEEEDLFPALRELGDASLTASIDELDAEHEYLGELWCCVQPWLEAISLGARNPAPPELNAFATLYPEHALREEREVYPAAVRLPHDRLAGIGQRMAQRRGARQEPWPS